MNSYPIIIRRATDADARTLSRLAALDSQSAPHGDALIAEVQGRPLAALALDSGRVIADPFRRTAVLGSLLRDVAAA